MCLARSRSATSGDMSVRHRGGRRRVFIDYSRGNMRLNLVVLPGDGVGPEVTAQAVRVLREVANVYGHSFCFEEHTIGGVAIRETGSPLPPVTLDACLRADAVLLGAIGSPEFDHLSSP